MLIDRYVHHAPTALQRAPGTGAVQEHTSHQFAQTPKKCVRSFPGDAVNIDLPQIVPTRNSNRFAIIGLH